MGPVRLNSGGTIETDAGKTLNTNQHIDGPGSLTKTGEGTLILNNSGNSYYGGTNINQGKVVINDLLSLGADVLGNNLSFGTDTTGGTLELGGLTDVYLSDQRQVTLNGQGGTIDTNNQQLTIAGTISGDGSLTKDGTGTLVLNGSNTYTGDTYANQGTIAINSNKSLGAADNTLYLGSSSDNATLRFDDDIDNLSQQVVLGSQGGTIDTQANEGTIASAITGGGAGPGQGLTKEGTGTLTLTGANTYTGGTVVDNGALQLGDGGTTGSITGNVSLTNSSSQLVVNRSDTVTDPGGVISGSGQFVQRGSGTTIFTQNNTYTGGTTIVNRVSCKWATAVIPAASPVMWSITEPWLSTVPTI